MFATERLSTDRQRPPTPRLAKRKLISFQLGDELYGLPIDRVKQILDEFDPHGDWGNGHELVRFQNQSLTFLRPDRLFPGATDLTTYSYLMICAIAQGQSIGIPLPQLPKVVEVTEDQFQPLPNLYRQAELPTAVIALIHLEGDREMFFLDPDQLVLLPQLPAQSEPASLDLPGQPAVVPGLLSAAESNPVEASEATADFDWIFGDEEAASTGPAVEASESVEPELVNPAQPDPIQPSTDFDWI
jgi:chemotaxis signal transduction protein